MIHILRQLVTCNIWVATLKAKVTAWPCSKIVSGPKLCYLKLDFTTTFDKLLLCFQYLFGEHYLVPTGSCLQNVKPPGAFKPWYTVSIFLLEFIMFHSGKTLTPEYVIMTKLIINWVKNGSLEAQGYYYTIATIGMNKMFRCWLYKRNRITGHKIVTYDTICNF